MLVDYFPTPLRERFAEPMAGHRLRREIVTTAARQRGGQPGRHVVLPPRVEETGAGAADVLRASVVIRDVYGLTRCAPPSRSWTTRSRPRRRPRSTWRSAGCSTARCAGWSPTAACRSTSPARSPGCAPASRACSAARHPLPGPRARGPARQHRPAARARPARRAGRAHHPHHVWLRPARHRRGRLQTGRDVNEVATVYYVLSERFRVDDLLSKISDLPREDRWQTLARMALRYDLYAALAALTAEVLDGDRPLRGRRGPRRRVGAEQRHVDRPHPQRHRRVRRVPRRPRRALRPPPPDPHPGPSLRRLTASP